MRRSAAALVSLLSLSTLAPVCASDAKADPQGTPEAESSAGGAKPAAGGGGELVAGDPLATGEGFHAKEEDPAEKAARLAREKDERKARKAAMLDKLRPGLPKGADKSPDKLWAAAEEQEKKQNWKIAEDAYRAFALLGSGERVPRATEKAMQLAFRRGEFGEGLQFFEDVFLDVEEPVLRARYARLLSQTMLAVPHWGTTRGGEFLRNRYDQGVQTQTYATDRARAIALLEEARGLLRGATPSPAVDELRIAVDFELITALTHFTWFDPSWGYWWSPWWADNVDDGTEDDEGADERADEYRGYRSWSDELYRSKPRGIPVDSEGRPLFSAQAASYEASADDTARMKFLVAEIGKIDASPKKESAARALLLQAMLFRARDGTERLDRLANWWWEGSRPYQADVEKLKQLQGLSDDEVVTLLATHVGVVKLPEDECVPRLLRRVLSQYPDAVAADDAAWLLGQFHQSRLQYPAALEDYDGYLKARAQGTHRGDVEAAKAVIQEPMLTALEHGPQPAGVRAKLRLKHRNIDKVEVVAVRLDLEKLMAEMESRWKEGAGRSDDDYGGPDQILWRYNNNPAEVIKRYGTSDKKSFSVPVKRLASFQTNEEDITTEVSEPGLWAVELKGGSAVARALLGLERYAVVSKTAKEGTLTWVTDARTGAPVDGAEVSVFTYWSDWNKNKETRHSKKEKKSTNGDGIAVFGARDYSNLIWAKKDGVMSFPVNFWTGRYYGNDGWGRENERVSVVMTDRTVYRPGDTVQLKLWARHKVNGQYKPASDVKRFWVRVYDPRGTELLTHDAASGEWGSTSFQVPLKKNAPLGAYRLEVQLDGTYSDAANATFRVEEYKAPEFAVEVRSAGDARLGEAVPIKVEAKYLAGGGVAGGKVHYKVYRQDHTVQWSAPGPWDWLYGRGYGRVWYPYPWFAWWDECVPGPIFWYPWWGPAPEAPRELVKEGEGVLDKDGALQFSVDTSKAAKDYANTDHKYTVVAEVVDPSRRLVKGEGEILVTRAAFLAVLEAETWWADPGKDFALSIATLKPDGSLFGADGKLIVEEVSGLGDGAAAVVGGGNDAPAPLVAKVVEQRPVKTDAVGPVRVTWRAPKTGQYRVSFVGFDQKQREVRSSVVLWAYGPDFQGQRIRTANLEILADKRTYQPGETARLLIHTDSDRAAVLLGTKVDEGALLEWRVIRTKDKSALVTVPITQAHTPNFFVEATTVKDALLAQEARELYVPPKDSELLVDVKVDRQEHKPGEPAEITVKTTDKEGKPIAAELALSVFDAATLQIQPDTMPDVRAHFWGRKRWHQPQAQSSLSMRFQMYQYLFEPFQRAAGVLSSFSSQFFQRPVDYRHATTVDTGASFNRLEFDDRLELQGNGAGGGGRALALGKTALADAAPAPEPASRAVAALKSEEKAKDAKGDRGRRDADEERAGEDKQQPNGAGPQVVVRKSFADTAFFSSSVVTDKDGVAKVRFKFPDNTTTWKVKAVGMDRGARAGRGDASMVTTKKLLVRLAAPRFFREKDQVTLSAIVQNRYDKKKSVDVSLDVDATYLTPAGALSTKVDVEPGAERRVDFVVTVKGEGQAKVRVTAKGADDADAKELTFPVLVHGMEKTVSSTGSISMGKGVSEKSFDIEVPKERRAEQTELVVRTSPSLAGAMVDALPYLLDYPYGCVEQTLSRFVPAVLTRRALQQAGGVKLEDLAAARTNLNAQQLTKDSKVDKDRLAREARIYDRNPIYNTAVLNDIIEQGLLRIRKMQHGDGGWGWWMDDESSTYMTAHALNALLDARDADLAIDGNMIERGRQALKNLVAADLTRWRRDKDWVHDGDAFAAMVMARLGDKNDELNKMLYERRILLSSYGKLLYARALFRLGDKEKASLLLQNAEQNLKEDKENETAWIETRSEGWWYWWNDDIETNAAYVRALDEMRKGDARTAGVVKWLLNHRKHGWYWDSTRDTAAVIAALGNHMQASGERNPDYDLEILVDGKPRKKVHIDKKNLYAANGDLVLSGLELDGGKHTVTIRRTGEGAVYFNSYLSFFTLEDDIKAAGLELKVDRSYFKLERQDRVHDVAGDRGQATQATELRYKKVPLASGAELKSGDVVLVELMITSKNNYTDLAFEDPKPAGAEPLALRSGTVVGEGVSHMELRDERVVFFLPEITQGKLKLTYRLRAEIPGKFSAMPTKAFAMYAPEIKANSDEMKLKIVDVP